MLQRIVDEKPVAPQVTDVFVDTVGDPDFYKSRLVANLGPDYGNFTIEKKADAKFKVVGAASIVAKVHRDTTLKEWKWAEPTVQLDKNFGSGYPGDENCVKWYVQMHACVLSLMCKMTRFSCVDLVGGSSPTITWFQTAI